MKQNKKLLILALIFIMVFAFVGYLPRPAQAATLVSHWNFDGNVNDSSGTNHGTLQGSASVSKNYLELSSSTSDYISIADDDSLSFNNGVADQPFSLAAWVKVDGLGNVKLFEKGDFTDNSREYTLYFNGSGGTIGFALYDNVQVGTLTASASITDIFDQQYISDSWMHVAATYDGTATAAGLKLYVNGFRINSTNNLASYTHMVNSATGARSGFIDTIYSDGDIDDLRLYSGELTVNEISSLFSSQALDYRNSRANVQALNADGNNLSAIDSLIADLNLNFLLATDLNVDDGLEISFASEFQDVDGVTDVNVSISQAYISQQVDMGAVSFSGNSARIIIDGQSDQPAAPVTINFNNVITSPLDDGTYIIILKSYDLGTDGLWGGSGADADTLESNASTAVVFGDFSIDISGSVDPTLTLTLDSFYDASGSVAATNTCNLSTNSKILISTEINLCLYAVHVSTNGTGGYTAYVRDTGDFSTGVDDMIDAGATMSPNPAVAEYGIVTTASGYNISQINNFTGGGVDGLDCAYIWTHGTQTGVNSSAITESDQSFAGAIDAVADDTTALCHMAAIAGNTPNGTYTTTTIITAVGNF